MYAPDEEQLKYYGNPLNVLEGERAGLSDNIILLGGGGDGGADSETHVLFYLITVWYFTLGYLWSFSSDVL